MNKYIALLPFLMFFSFLTSCIDKEEWLAQNNDRTTSKTDSTKTETDSTKKSTDFVEEYVVNEPVRDYDTITLYVKSASPITKVYMPTVKYNLKTALVFISDDMTQNDAMRGWTLFNGYPVGKSSNIYSTYFTKILDGTEGLGSDMDIHDPYVYSTDDGKSKRWSMTTAVWPSEFDGINYTRINAYDAKCMMRTGHSFQQHDLISNISYPSLEQQVALIPQESNIWKKITGVGTKMIIEPSGDKSYMEAARMSSHICMGVCQATSVGYLHSYQGMTYYSSWKQADDDEYIYTGEISRKLSDWAQGDCVPDYTHKTHNMLVRNFLTDDSKVNNVLTQLESGQNMINVFGTHGLSSALVTILKRIKDTEGLWVTSIDDFWEYYYLKKNVKIKVEQEEGRSKIILLVPQYSEHQFRDFTVNIDARDVTDVTFSNNVVTSGWRQNYSYCTINVGLETRMYKYITEYLNFAYKHPESTCVQRDIEYLISLLTDGEMKDKYQKLYNQIYSND